LYPFLDLTIGLIASNPAGTGVDPQEWPAATNLTDNVLLRDSAFNRQRVIKMEQDASGSSVTYDLLSLRRFIVSLPRIRSSELIPLRSNCNIELLD
jgi:hypothetical protein